MKKWDYIVSWLPIGIVVTLMSFMVYGVAQQTIRLGANSEPMALAQDAADQIVRGAPAKAVIPKENVDMATTLLPYLIVYDDRGSIQATNVVLDGKVPEIPAGVLMSARERKEDNVTWQPKSGVRSAAVIVRFVGDQPGFVLAGKSLREVENLTDKLLIDVVIGWVVTMMATLLAYYILRR